MGYVLGVIFFLGIAGYMVTKFVIKSFGCAIEHLGNQGYKDFRPECVDAGKEIVINAKLLQDAKYRQCVIAEIGKVINKYPMPSENHIAIALEYLLSKEGLVSRYAAEMGCYRIPDSATKQEKQFMYKYMRLLQKNICKARGWSILFKEVRWADYTRGYVWYMSPGDPEYWESEIAQERGYKCIYRTGSP